MPTVAQNQQTWSTDYQWQDAGDEWSAAWGSPEMQWYGTILPRIHRFVPTESILESACGYGRWTQYLQGLCQKLVAVDLTEKCIAACKSRCRGASLRGNRRPFPLTRCELLTTGWEIGASSR